MVLASEGRFSGVECDADGYVGEVVEKTHGKYHNVVVNSECCNLLNMECIRRRRC